MGAFAGGAPGGSSGAAFETLRGYGSGFRVSGFKVWRAWLRVWQSLGFRVWGAGFRVAGFRVQGLGFKFLDSGLSAGSGIFHIEALTAGQISCC